MLENSEFTDKKPRYLIIEGNTFYESTTDPLSYRQGSVGTSDPPRVLTYKSAVTRSVCDVSEWSRSRNFNTNAHGFVVVPKRGGTVYIIPIETECVLSAFSYPLADGTGHLVVTHWMQQGHPVFDLRPMDLARVHYTDSAILNSLPQFRFVYELHEQRLHLHIFGFFRAEYAVFCREYDIVVKSLDAFLQTLANLGVHRDQIIEAKDFQDV